MPPPKRRDLQRALVVDDDPVCAMVVFTFIRSHGLNVSRAGSVAEARELLAEPFDLVVTDVRLPDGSGVDVAASACAQRPIPLVIAMSAGTTAATAFDLWRAGVLAFIEKPVNAEALWRTVDRLIADPPSLSPLVAAHVGRNPLAQVREGVRARMLDQALELAGGDLARAGELLGITPQAVDRATRRRALDPD